MSSICRKSSAASSSKAASGFPIIGSSIITTHRFRAQCISAILLRNKCCKRCRTIQKLGSSFTGTAKLEPRPSGSAPLPDGRGSDCVAERTDLMSSSMAVPLCDLQTQLRELEPQLLDAVTRVLRSGQVINGPEAVQFEQDAANYCGAGYGVGCSSGSDALLLALPALGVGPGDEVILPPFTFFAIVGAVCRLGAHPVFADIDSATFNLDPAEIASKITPRTRAIMVVHLFGQTADMTPIAELAERHGV